MFKLFQNIPPKLENNRHDIGIFLCMQALGGDAMWFDRFAAQHAVSRLSRACVRRGYGKGMWLI